MSQAQGWELTESKDLKRTSLCSATAQQDQVLSQAGKQEKGRAFPNEQHEQVGSRAGLKVRRPKAQLVRVSNPPPTLAPLQRRAAERWPERPWCPLFPCHCPQLQQRKVGRWHLSSILSGAENQMLSNNTTVPNLQESLSAIPQSDLYT